MRAPTTDEATTESPTTVEPTTDAPTTEACFSNGERVQIKPASQYAHEYSGCGTLDDLLCSGGTATIVTWDDGSSFSYHYQDLESCTQAPTTKAPTTEAPSTEAPTTEAPTTRAPTTDEATTESPTTVEPTTEAPTTEACFSNGKRVQIKPASQYAHEYDGCGTLGDLLCSDGTLTSVTWDDGSTFHYQYEDLESCTQAPATEAPTTEAPSTEAPTTKAPTTEAPTTKASTTEAPTTEAPTTKAPTTMPPTTKAPTTVAP